MAATAPLSFISFMLLFSLKIQAQTPAAPAPAPPGPVNLTGILEKNGQFTTFIRLLNQTQVGTQLYNQLNGSTEGFTVFAPTDNAFANLERGALNGLNNQQQVQLVLYHIVPKYYTLSNLLLVSNPVRTQATGQDSGVWGLNFTGQGNQVNVSTGIVETQINNALTQAFPLAVYQVDRVLLPEELFGVKPPTAAPAGPAPRTKSSSSGSNSTEASEPSSDQGGSSGKNVAMGVIVGLGMVCMGVLS